MGLKKKLKKLGKKIVRGTTAIGTGGLSEVALGVGKKIKSDANKLKEQGKKIGAAEEEAARQGEALNREAIGGFNPYTQAGESGLSAITGALGLGGKAPDFSAITNSPAYQFLQEQGIAGVRSALPPSLLGSGREQKELARFSSGLASQSLDQFLNRAQALASGGQQSQTSIGELLLDIAKKRRQGLVGSEEAIAAGEIGKQNQQRADIGQIVDIGKTVGSLFGGG